MSLGIVSKFAIVAVGLLSTIGVAQSLPAEGYGLSDHNYQPVQYYPQREGPREYYRRGPDPRHACEQAGGDFYRIPSKNVRAVDMRQVGPNVYVVTVAIRGNTVDCTVDGNGNVLRFGRAY